MALTRTTTLSYGMGGAPYAVKEAAFTMFVLLFYTQVLGLSGTATGIVIFVSLVWDAVSDPLMGAWSDRFKSRWGRRHPFMAVGTIPLALGHVALFFPPQWVQSSSAWLTIWLLLCSLWIRTWVTVFALPHLALAAEITDDYHQRSTLLGSRIGFVFLVSILLPALSMFLLFNETNGADGRFVADNYIVYGWASALVIALAGLIVVYGTRDYIPATRIDPARMPSSPGLRGVVADFLSTLRNVNFRNLLFYDLAASASYGITVALNVMVWTYFWEFDASTMAAIMGIPVFTAVPLALVTMAKLGKRWPKHKILKYAIFLMLVDVVWIYPLHFLGLLPENGHWLITAMVLLQNFIFVFLFVLRNIASYSITADLTDEHESYSGKRQEGGFYSVLAFTTKLASAAGPLYSGFALDVIGLKEGMMPGELDATVTDNLAWALLLAVVPLMLVAWRYTLNVSMSEQQLLDIQATLGERSQQQKLDVG